MDTTFSFASWFVTFVNSYLTGKVIDILFAILVLVVGFSVVKMLSKALQKTKGFKKLDSNVKSFFTNFIELMLKVIVVLTAVIIIGVPESSVIAVLGSCGLAIGLALQGGLSNIASGVILMFCKPFHVGDFISSSGVSGTVKDINIYYTLITTGDNQDISVPNSTLANSMITNLSTESTRRLDFDFSISYDADIDAARKVILETAQANEKIAKDPAPVVLVAAHGDSAITMKLRVWCDSNNYWAVNFEMWENVKKALDKAGIEIPYQYVNVIMKNS
ncbi:MAG: mechanosensitive ion channel [Clostridia bacterium]|nr:mechanosensitive ion channel [Clostridia bacterium]